MPAIKVTLNGKHLWHMHPEMPHSPLGNKDDFNEDGKLSPNADLSYAHRFGEDIRRFGESIGSRSDLQEGWV